MPPSKNETIGKSIHRRLRGNSVYRYWYYSIWNRKAGEEISGASTMNMGSKDRQSGDQSRNVKVGEKRSGEAESRFRDSFAELFESEPLAERTILYESFHGTRVACNPKAIFLEALSDQRFENYTHIWSLQDESVFPDEFRSLENVKTVNRNTIDYVRALATSSHLVSNSTFPSWYVRREGQTYMNTWHGIPLKNMFRFEGGKFAGFANSQRNFLQASHIILPSAFAAEKVLDAAHVLELTVSKTYLIGSPRLDRMVNSAVDRGTSARKRVLFAPTWRGEVSRVSDQSEVLNSIIKAIISHFGLNIQLYVKAHNFFKADSKKLTSGVEYALDHSLFMVGDDADFNELATEMDAVITDYSSVMFDTISANIATILYTPDIEEYVSARGISLALEELPVAVTRDIPELMTAIQVAKAPKEFPKKIYQNTIQKICGEEDGAASRRALDLLLGEDTDLQPISKKQKPAIFVMAGGWKRNGITNSVINLLNNLDRKKYAIAVLTDGASLSAESQNEIKRLPPHVMLLHRDGAEGFTKSETAVKVKYYAMNNLKNADEWGLMERAMRREWRRLYGLLPVKTAVDFSGYRRLWAWIVAMSNSETKIIFQHNDMLSEAKLRFPELVGVFATYKYYNYIASVSDQTRDLNQANLKAFFGNGRSVTVRNTLNADQIEIEASRPIETFEYNGATLMALHADRPANSDVFLVSAISTPGDNPHSFVCIGRFSKEKNHELLLRAFAQVVRVRPQAYLYILGEGPLFAETVKLRNSLNLASNVCIPGYTDKAMQILSNASCMVLPSLYEGQPMVILEALALGKPVIVTDIPGSNGALTGGYGYVLTANTEDCLAKAMLDFCEDKLKFKRFDIRQYNSAALKEFHAMLE